jgi:hypothetical protein
MRIVIGFIAAALAVLVAHQPIVLLLGKYGMLPPTAIAYNMANLPHAPAALVNIMKSIGFQGWPTLFNSVFWGGLWGIVFALIHSRLPGGLMIVKGLVFGILVMIFSNWLLVPFIKGTLLQFPNTFYFANAIKLTPGFSFDASRLLPGFLIQCGFGAATGLLYGLMRRDA